MYWSSCITPLAHTWLYQQKRIHLKADDVTRNDVKQNVDLLGHLELPMNVCSNFPHEHCALSCLQYIAIGSQRHNVMGLSGTQSCIHNPISDTESEVPAWCDCSPHLRHARVWMAFFWISLCFALVSTDEEGWSSVTPFICYLLKRLESRRHGRLWEVAEAQTLLT